MLHTLAPKIEVNTHVKTSDGEGIVVRRYYTAAEVKLLDYPDTKTYVITDLTPTCDMMCGSELRENEYKRCFHCARDTF